MQRTFLNKQVGQIIFIFVSLMPFIPFTAAAQIALLDEPIPLKPKEFYIAGVNDDRTDKSATAQVAIKTTIEPTDLKGGTVEAVRQFIEHNLPKDQSLKPVVIDLKDLKLKETILPNGSVDGHIQLHLSFGLQKNYGTEHLVDYNSGLHYVRRIDNVVTIERNLHLLLVNGLVYFNDWMKANADHNRKLAKNVKLIFTDYTEKTEGDTIYYSASRPLTWADFQSHIRATSVFEAQVMPGFGYNQQAEMIKGTINVKIAVKTYVPKSACWANYSGRDDYTLNHEQRHFDIVKIISDQFKQKILDQKLTPDNFEAIINMQYLDSYRDMDAMQEAYDKETSHGTNRFAQGKWNDRIDKELK